MFYMSGSQFFFVVVPQKVDPGNVSQASKFESWDVCV